MTTAGSSIISALGAGSGVDFIKLASDISAASFAAQRDAVTARKTSLEAQISAAGQLRGAVTGLASALGDRIRNGDLAPKGEIANPAVARVTVPPGLSPRGNFQLEVTQLASSQTLVGRAYASRDALVGEGQQPTEHDAHAQEQQPGQQGVRAAHGEIEDEFTR